MDISQGQSRSAIDFNSASYLDTNTLTAKQPKPRLLSLHRIEPSAAGLLFSLCQHPLLVARSQPVILRSADPLLCTALFQVICQLFAVSLVWPGQSAPHTILEQGAWSHGASQGGRGTQHKICFKQKMCSTRGGALLCRQQVLKWHTAISVAVAST